jgi:hypothetical protein
MAYIAIPTAPNFAPVISRFGDGDTDVELSFRLVGEMVELVATKVEYTSGGIALRTEISSKTVSKEDAGSVACDMEWKAAELLEADGIDGYAYPLGFDEAVEKELANSRRESRDNYMARAIAHNAAMIAAE